MVAPKSPTLGSLNFGELPDVVLAKNCSKTPKNGSCRFRHYQMQISQKSPNLDHLTSVFGVFEQFLAKPHLEARQNVTFLTLGWCMSALDLKFKIWFQYFQGRDVALFDFQPTLMETCLYSLRSLLGTFKRKHQRAFNFCIFTSVLQKRLNFDI